MSIISRASLVLVMAVSAVLAVAGCSPSVGYVVKPVPINEPLTETTIATDRGWFVSDKIAIIDVDGVIFNQRPTGIFGPHDNPVNLFVEKMDKAQADEDVKALVLRINSPGGGVTASDIMYHRVQQFRQAKPNVPIIACIQDVGASGAYYIACAAQSIIASPTSITGSIGVIVQTMSFAGTMEKIGIDAKAVTSGKYKDMGNPFKALDKDDQALIQAMVNEFYDGFVKIVVAGRPGLKEVKVRELADGRVYTGIQAKANGLVDELGYMDDAIRIAKERAGLSKCMVIMYDRPWGHLSNAYSAAQNNPAQVNLVNFSLPDMMASTQPRFMYLWTGK